MPAETDRDTSSVHADASTQNQPTAVHSESSLLKALSDLADFLGRTPEIEDVNEHGRYSIHHYQNRFGSLESALAKANLRSLGSRDNWWGDDDHAVTPTGHAECSGTSSEEYKAYNILRANADLLCPECMVERNRAVTLSDPSEYIPKEVETSFGTVELHVLRHRRRVCPAGDCGYVSFGGVLADRPAEEFMDLVNEVLSALDMPASRRRKLRSDAKARKHRGNKHDQEIMTKFVDELLNPDPLDD